MKRYAPILVAALALTAFAAVAFAGDRDIDETHDVNRDAVVSIDNLAGSITIVGWDRDKVEIKGTLDRKADRLQVEGNRDELEVKVKYPKKKKNLSIRKGSVLEIRVPEHCSLELEGVSCDIDVSDFHGQLEAGSISGNIRVVGDTESIDVSTVSGDVYVESATDMVEIESISGFVEVKGVRKSLEISMVSGEAEVSCDELLEFSFNCVSGDLDIDATPAPGADWELECHSGELTLHLPKDLSAEFDIELFSGDVHNEFGPEARRTSKFAPGKELRFTAGDGEADIEISTFSGDIRLVRR